MTKHCLVGIWENSTNWSLICKVGGQLPTGVLSLDTNPVYYIDAYKCDTVECLSVVSPGGRCKVFSAISRITLLSGQTPSILDNIFIHPGTFYT